MQRRLMFAGAISISVLAGAAEARADTRCGSRSSTWNAPNGALVLSRSDSVIGRVLTGAGEWRSHSMISHGGWATHSAFDTEELVGEGYPAVCTNGPATTSSIRDGKPGMEAINMGAVYAYWFLSEDPVVYKGWQLANSGTHRTRARATADWLWWDAPYQWIAPVTTMYCVEEIIQGVCLIWVPGEQVGGGYYQIRDSDGAFQPYVFFQYRSIEDRETGGSSWRHGTVCSTSIAWANKKAGNPTISAHAYSHSQMVSLMNGLHNAADDKCSDTPDFYMDLGTVLCAEQLCDDFARQLRNCAAAGTCNSDSSSVWNDIANDSATRAITISPSDLGGWDGHDWGNSNNGPWAQGDEGTYWDNGISWNVGGGAVYGCW